MTTTIDILQGMHNRYVEGLEAGREIGLDEGIEKGIEMGREKGLEEGMEKGINLMAEQLRKAGMSEDEVRRIIGSVHP